MPFLMMGCGFREREWSHIGPAQDRRRCGCRWRSRWVFEIFLERPLSLPRPCGRPGLSQPIDQGGHQASLAAVHILRIDGWMMIIRASTRTGWRTEAAECSIPP